MAARHDQKDRGMIRLARLTAATAVAGLVAGAAIAVSPLGAQADTAVGACTAQGAHAYCVTSGLARDPVTLTVRVSASPDQDVSVVWHASCSQGGTSGTTSATFTARTPIRRAIWHAYYQPDFCIVSASAKLVGSGSVHVTLSSSPTGPVTGYAGKCADDTGNSSAPGTKIQLWSCLNNASQQWAYSGRELRHGTMCMSGGGSGAPVVLRTCTGASNEIWSHTSGGEYVLKANGLCLDDPAYATRNGTQLIVYRCNGHANQRWSLP